MSIDNGLQSIAQAIVGAEDNNPCYFRWEGRSTAMGTAVNGAWTTIRYETLVSDYGNNFDGYIFVAPYTGLYLMSGTMSLETTTNTYRYIYQFNNNISSRHSRVFDLETRIYMIGGSTVMYLVWGDEVVPYFYHAVGSDRTYYGTTGDALGERNYWEGCLLRRLE